MEVTCPHVILLTLFNLNLLKLKSIQPDGSSKFEYVQNKDGETIYTKVKAEASPQYYSERGENTPPRLDKDLFEFLDKGEEYAYVWEEGFWMLLQSSSI